MVFMCYSYCSTHECIFFFLLDIFPLKNQGKAIFSLSFPFHAPKAEFSFCLFFNTIQKSF